ncbi:hypothetical protein GCM10011499_35600 [Pelagibacterium lentulum]|uniref:Uncharacterized protein n=1 Tax=Pelagibacterium lentulum TaxID=2029865 RepID=A0A916W355_9HYPH|nr:hypothetical protein GCM10011499_35600 [Pelagibacterium lentulum]
MEPEVEEAIRLREIGLGNPEAGTSRWMGHLVKMFQAREKYTYRHRDLAAQWADFKEEGSTAALFHAALTRIRLTLDVQLINQVN